MLLKEVEMGSEAKDYFFIKYDPESDCMVINRLGPGDFDMNAYMNRRHEKYERIILAKSYAKAVKKYWKVGE